MQSYNGNLGIFGTTYLHGTGYASKQWLLSKGSYRYGEPINVIAESVQKTVAVTGLQTTWFHVTPCTAENENLGKVLVKCRQNVANKLFISRYFNPVVPTHPCVLTDSARLSVY